MTIEERERDFRNAVNLKIAFPYDLRKEFADYWTEPNKSGTKMLFELEKTWDLGRRLTRWANNGFGINTGAFKTGAAKSPAIAFTSVHPPMPAPTNEVEKIDQFLKKYMERPTDIPFAEFGQWYDYMKKEKLLKPMFQKEIDELREIYNCDNSKCRCAVVQITLNGYVNSGITFSDIFKMRLKLV